MKALFCTEGSDISLLALENVSKYLKNIVLDIICVIDWSFLPDSMNIDRETYSRTYESIADSVLNFAEDAIKEKGLSVGKKVKNFGSPVEGILEQVQNDSYDLIIMGSHGKKGLQKWLGSVSRQVLTNVSMPVFISKRKNEGKKILIAIDGSEISYSAVKQATELFDFTNKEIHVVSVKETPELLPVEVALDKKWIDDIDKQQKIHASKAINKVKSILASSNLSVINEVILTGHPAHKVIEFAQQENIDLIVMGARTKASLSTFLLGSVSKRVLENTNSDVLIVRK
ncbi:MAG TPA: universal stress protein [Candidatus Gastranaerophilaceae bacterium]|nr:universal stress protein [Candidatus Gastranaerophilaceae bacterium]HPT42111.1 universal stress protein [Candidatus Gastranaerophilaceae bacterium]